MSLNNTEDNGEKIVDLENVKLIKRGWEQLSVKEFECPSNNLEVLMTRIIDSAQHIVGF